MKRFFILTLVFLGVALTAQQAQAQYYKSAIGLRFGYPTSASFKTFITGPVALEANVGVRGVSSSYRWIQVGGLLEWHKDLELGEFSVDGLEWYVGGGAGAVFWTYFNDFNISNYSSTSLVVMGVLGLQYTFQDIPVTLSTDWAPTFFLGDTFVTGFRADYGAFSIRYVLGE
ncbi:hypothetical protein [Pontibacter sp. G13]|uniref:hypothetical protein n=1 Tax=Pontibacter sp. G13 TaxID=3074898 RepID=UPI00288B066B|nr:hypothetical protein [Pontibacter sp. G13]WNJ21093.1 hypothetical protein RJD25_11540 [Pontibacter sp. G13]